MPGRNEQPAELGAGISRPLVLLLAFTCGAAVANLYYAQPLLHTIAHAFSVSNSAAGLLVTVTQAGYVVGLALLVPLGDLLERRRLIAAMLLAGVLRWALPRVPTTERLGYPALLGTVLHLVRDEPLLRQRMLLGATAFGCFSVLWTSVAFLLSGAPYHYGNAVIGLFGLAGLAGALVAPVAGRLSDRGRGREAMSGSILLLLLSWGLLAFGKSTVIALIAGIVVLDLGAQAMHISNQSAVYSLHGQARSRLTTAYMVAYFSGGVALSAATSALYSSGGWSAVCALGAGTAAVGLITWLVTERVMTGRLPIGADSSA
jgi:predicted MFS family arabinose efflux permease